MNKHRQLVIWKTTLKYWLADDKKRTGNKYCIADIPIEGTPKEEIRKVCRKKI